MTGKMTGGQLPLPERASFLGHAFPTFSLGLQTSDHVSQGELIQLPDQLEN